MSRILFPDALHASTSSYNNNIHSFKAPYRPGKIPTDRPSIKRNDSIVSLPSPPSERKLRKQQCQLNVLGDSDGEASGSDTDVEMTQEEGLAPAAQIFRQPNGRNPFLDLYDGSMNAKGLDRPDHPQQSPTQQVRRNRRKVDIERIQLGSPVREKEKEVQKEVKEGWNDLNNPFLVKKGDKVEPHKKGSGKQPTQMTYVFRGKRITYDVPFSALISSSPDESPFAVPSPRLLFPPQPKTPPSDVAPTPSFLDALKGSRSAEKEVKHGLPTPARDGKRKTKAFGDDNERNGKKRREMDMEL